MSTTPNIDSTDRGSGDLADVLRREVQKLHAMLDMAAAEKGAIQAEASFREEELRNLLKAAQARLEDYERAAGFDGSAAADEPSELRSARAIAASLKNALSLAEARHEEARREFAEKERALAALTIENEQRGANMRAAVRAMNALKEELKDALLHNATLKAQADEAAAKAENARREAARLEELLRSARAEQGTQSHELEGLREAAEMERRAAQERFAAETAAISARLNDMRKTLAEKTVENEWLVTDAARSNVALQEERAENARLRAELDSSERETRQAKLGESSARVELEQALRQLTARWDRLIAERRAQDAQGSGQVESLRSELQREKDNAAALKKALKEAPPASSAQENAPPPLEDLSDPAWTRFLPLVRPPLESAYAHLRQLSAAPLRDGQKTLVRLAAAAMTQATSALASMELALDESPALGPPTPVIPDVAASLSAWEPALRKNGVTLVRELPSAAPAAPHDAKVLKILVHQIVGNAFDALPRGGRLTVRASTGGDGALRLEFADDGRGFGEEWLQRPFEPTAAPRRGRAGLGLYIVRRTMRRWGGDAEASNGRGARVVLLFAPPVSPASRPPLG